ncbi:ABC1 kinase family protein [Nocardia camponoti]|uniref:ATP-binding protein n=1 Tax=Nocardia camponoti TaxID=1616106 RepID=A0A917QA84_9NOCA|nr:AarF/ABC1/UbiB kinase family protein [Nocardia camponoti]GGK37853.1 putative ATP-binding protein [Nocardia camponoti]
MAHALPRGRAARSAKLGTFAAAQAAREIGRRLSVVGRTEEARRVLAEESSLRTAQQLVAVLGALKGSAMKLGQMASVLDLDFVPESHRERFRQQFATLRDNAPAIDFNRIRPVIEADLGPLATTFAEFDPTPTAAASIGQVHRAILHDGRVVAVKAKYPGVDAAVAADIDNLEFLARMAKSVLPSIADSALLGEVARNLTAELDYLREAEIQHRIAAQYRGHPFITVPDTILSLCGPNVLVSEFVDARPFNDLRTMPPADRAHYGELIYRFYLSRMFQEREFCGDPHPGNILLTHDGRLAFLDFGLYHEMDATHVEFERSCMIAAIDGRADDLYAAWVGRGIIDPTSAVTPAETLEYVWAVAGWHLLDEEIEVSPATATAALLLAADPRSTRFDAVHRQLLPHEHVFSRRADLFTFATLGQLNVRTNWHRIAREWLYDEAPTTPVGQAIARWRTRLGD